MALQQLSIWLFRHFIFFSFSNCIFHLAVVETSIHLYYALTQINQFNDQQCAMYPEYGCSFVRSFVLTSSGSSPFLWDRDLCVVVFLLLVPPLSNASRSIQLLLCWPSISLFHVFPLLFLKFNQDAVVVVVAAAAAYLFHFPWLFGICKRDGERERKLARSTWFFQFRRKYDNVRRKIIS